MPIKREQTGLRLPVKTLEKLKERAAEKEVSLNRYCTELIESHLGIKNVVIGEGRKK